MHNSTGHLFSFFKNRELNELYVSLAIRAFSLSLIGVFFPIYLYKIGYPLFSSKYGIKHSILISIPFLIGFFFLLYSIGTYNVPLILLALFDGISTAMFWVPYHIDFAKFSSKKNRGKQIGVAAITASVISVLGPIAGAGILVFAGFKVL